MKDLDEGADASPRALFEHSVRRLDLPAGNRLRLARRAALSGAGAHAGLALGWRPALAAAVVLALGVAWWMPTRFGAVPARAPVVAAGSAAATATASDDGLINAESDDPDLYAWLAEAPVAADDAGAEHKL